jgi:hypothetical protein
MFNMLSIKTLDCHSLVQVLQLQSDLDYSPSIVILLMRQNTLWGAIVIWLGNGPYTAIPEGFTVLYGAEGKAVWDKAKAEWIKNHPQVPRLPSDP